MTPPRPYHLAEMTSPEIGRIDKDRAVVLVPVGAFEQHGPAMPMATDQIRARGLCDVVVERLDGAAYIGPELPVGISIHHTAFAGTVSLKPETFIQVIVEFCLNLQRSGWRRILVVTGHGGNNSALGVVAQRLMGEAPELEFAWTPITTLASETIRGFGTEEVTGHCGEAETAQMLRFAPELVRGDLLEVGTTRLDQLDPLARLSRQARPSLSVMWDRLSANGVLGDPRRASAELGERIVEDAAEAICTYIRTWINGSESPKDEAPEEES